MAPLFPTGLLLIAACGVHTSDPTAPVAPAEAAIPEAAAPVPAAESAIPEATEPPPGVEPAAPAPPPEGPATVPIGTLRAEAVAWEGRTVRVAGACRGWQCPGAPEGPALTRSDVCVEDETGTIYFSGVPAEGECNARSARGEGQGAPVVVEGTVQLGLSGAPWIDARPPEFR